MESKPLSLELLPMDGAPAVPPQAAAPLPAIEIEIGTAAAAPAAPVDRFLVEATCQFNDGHIDEPLWTRALAQADGDKDRATESYLRARATALKVIDRELRARQRKPEPKIAPPSPDAPVAEIVPAGNRSRRGRTRLNMRYGTAIGATLVSVVVCVWVLDSLFRSEVPAPAVAALAPASYAPKQPRSAPPQEAAPAPVTPAAANAPTKEFLAKVQELQDSGNWNVLVLYASEWTRKEPLNAAAWNQLSLGYANLRQYADARDAAKTALKIAPTDPRYWRNLAQIHLDLDEPAEALQAFEHAVGADAKDGYSLVQSGVLNMQLGRVTEARAAFDRALELTPDDADALCLKALLASRQNAPKGTTPNPKAGNGKCRDVAGGAPVNIAAGEGLALKPATARH
jgi:Flp pilus assembly protein TadD